MAKNTRSATPRAESIYADIYEAPEQWRKLNGVPLTLDQINRIALRAQQLGTESAIDIGAARAEFRAENEVRDGQWIRRIAEAE